MTTELQLQKDLATAMKARAMDEVYVLRGVVAAIKNLKIEKMVRELGESEIAAILRKEMKKRDETIEFATQGNRLELVAENTRQKAVLERYLPRQLSETELTEIVGQISAELGTSSIGPIMARLREAHAGCFDGQLASRVIRALESAPQ